jgi:hypothetical protein
MLEDHYKIIIQAMKTFDTHPGVVHGVWKRMTTKLSYGEYPSATAIQDRDSFLLSQGVLRKTERPASIGDGVEDWVCLSENWIPIVKMWVACGVI